MEMLLSKVIMSIRNYKLGLEWNIASLEKYSKDELDKDDKEYTKKKGQYERRLQFHRDKIEYFKERIEEHGKGSRD